MERLCDTIPGRQIRQGVAHLWKAASRSAAMKISAVLPAYNAERFLPRCLASVFAPTLEPYEVIVVDDGSTDGTAQVAEKLGATVFRQANKGLAAARNAGIRRATGEWIATLDADDWSTPEAFALQAVAVRPDTVLVYTGVRYSDDQGASTVLHPPEAASVKNAPSLSRPNHAFICSPSTADRFTRRWVARRHYLSRGLGNVGATDTFRRARHSAGAFIRLLACCREPQLKCIAIPQGACLYDRKKKPFPKTGCEEVSATP